MQKWVEGGVPLGISKPIIPKGVFPPNDKEGEIESTTDAMAQLCGGNIANYTSVRENMEDAKIEIDRLVEKGIVMRLKADDIRKDFPSGTISKLALIVKERPDGSKKRRLIIDLRRSGGNSKAKLEEKLVLPRSVDIVQSIKELVRLQNQPTLEQERSLWRRELILVDVSDAFPHLGVHPSELGHCLTPDVQSDDEHFLLFRPI